MTITEADADDGQFFAQNAGRNYRARPATLDETGGCPPDGNTMVHHRPANPPRGSLAIDHSRRNGQSHGDRDRVFVFSTRAQQVPRPSLTKGSQLDA